MLIENTKLTTVFPVARLVLVRLYGSLAPTQVFELPAREDEITQSMSSSTGLVYLYR